MKIYSEENVKYIVEEFLARLFKLDIAMLDENSIMELKEICDGYGLDVSSICEDKQEKGNETT